MLEGLMLKISAKDGHSTADPGDVICGAVLVRTRGHPTGSTAAIFLL